jgi:hypothetical protein
MTIQTTAWGIREDYVSARMTGDFGDLAERCTAWLARAELHERGLREQYVGRLLESQLDVLSSQRDCVRAVFANCR